MQTYWRAFADLGRAKLERAHPTAGYLPSIREQFRTTHAAAFEELSPLVGAGLEQRENTFLLPGGVALGGPLEDWIAWRVVQRCLATLGIDTTQHLCVCEGCTAVFRPKYRTARRCPLCEHKLPAPGLGTERTTINQRGGQATVRAPKFYDGTTVVKSWSRVTIRLCPECGGPFDGSAKKLVCSKRCKSRKARRKR